MWAECDVVIWWLEDNPTGLWACSARGGNTTLAVETFAGSVDAVPRSQRLKRRSILMTDCIFISFNFPLGATMDSSLRSTSLRLLKPFPTGLHYYVRLVKLILSPLVAIAEGWSECLGTAKSSSPPQWTTFWWFALKHWHSTVTLFQDWKIDCIW